MSTVGYEDSTFVAGQKVKPPAKPEKSSDTLALKSPVNTTHCILIVT